MVLMSFLLFCYICFYAFVLRATFEKVSIWFKANKLSVNASKTNFMILATHTKTNATNKNIGDIILDNT